MRVGSKIFIADGLLSLEVVELNDDHVMSKVLNDAAIGSRKNCNLPGAIIDLPAVSEKDVQDLKFGVKNQVQKLLRLVEWCYNYVIFYFIVQYSINCTIFNKKPVHKQDSTTQFFYKKPLYKQPGNYSISNLVLDSLKFRNLRQIAH